MKISLQDFDFYSDKCHVMGSADQMGEPPNSFLWWLHDFIFSPTVPNGPISPTPVVSRDWQECVKSASVMSDSLRLYGLCPARLLCPWGFPGRNTGVGCHAFLQGIFLTQGLNQHILYLLHWQVGSLHQCRLEAPGEVGNEKFLFHQYRVPAMWDGKFLEVLCTILSLELTVLYCIYKFHKASSCCSVTKACLF